MKYLAILGQNRELSLAELLAVYPGIKIISRHAEAARGHEPAEAVVFDSEEKINIERLGGLPKLAEISGEAADITEAKKIIIEELKKFSQDKKIFFGLSFYNNENRKKYINLGKEIKRELQDGGYKLRWVSSNEMALSSVIIKTNKLLTRGADFCLVFPSSRHSREGGNPVIIIAKTADVQDFFDYEFRDMRRPARDLYSGMTPPKLAKIMINLASPPFEKGRLGGIFLDPFCGSGTLLSEAALLGYEKICGSDVSAKAVSDSQKNFSWLKEKYNLPQESEIKLCDIKNISACWPNKFNAIATEPYLGPPIRGELSFVQAEKMQKELSGLYEIYLKNLSSILEKNGTLVLIVPFFMAGEKNLPQKSPPTPLFKRGGDASPFEKGGLRGILKNGAGRDFHITLKIKENGLVAVRPSILYSRPDQKIGREIYILKKM